MLARWLFFMPMGLWACSCGPGAWAPLCATFSSVNTVFLGTVLDHNDDGSGTYLQWTNYLVRVDEAFKGLDPDQKEIFIDPGSFTSCYGGFTSGKQYLFVIGKPAYTAAAIVGDATGGKGYPQRWESKRGLKVYFVIGCNPSGLVEDKAEDIAWYRAWQKGQTRTRVFGLAVQNYDSLFAPPNMKEVVPAAGASILLRNDSRQYEVSSNADGRFAFEGIEPGSYNLSASGNRKWIPPKTRQLTVTAGGCATRNLDFAADETLSGILLNHEGRPASGVNVQLVQVLPDGQLSPRKTLSVETDDKGRFEMKKVAFGEFVLGVNIASPPAARQPFAPTYFPGVRDASAAQRISPGSKDLMFRLPLPLRTRKVTVRLFGVDGSPMIYGGRVSISVQNQQVESADIKSANVAEFDLVEGLDAELTGESIDLSRKPWRLESEKVLLPGGTGPATLSIRLKTNNPAQ